MDEEELEVLLLIETDDEGPGVGWMSPEHNRNIMNQTAISTKKEYDTVLYVN